MFVLRKLLIGSVANLARLGTTVVLNLSVPPLLAHALTRDEYSAWVLIIQISTYVALFDLGLQTVVSRFIAEHHAARDVRSAARVLSTAIMLLAAAAMAGIVLTLVLAILVPTLFGTMTVPLQTRTSIALILVGCTSAIALPFGPFVALFTGMQRYVLPTSITLVGKIVQGIALIVAAQQPHAFLLLAVVYSVATLLIAIAQLVAWRISGRTTADVGLRYLSRTTVRGLLSSGLIISLWSLGGLAVNGLDTVIVGHFAFALAGTYALAATAATLMPVLVQSIFQPFMPAIAASRATSNAKAVGKALLDVTQICTVVLVVVGSALIALAQPLLTLWVGPQYGPAAAPLFQVLVVANVVRMLCYPYSLVVVATDTQRRATIATLSEAVVNLGVSLVLAATIGAIGVALGTLTGAVVSIALHLVLSMHATRDAIAFRRRELLLQGFLRPTACVVPAAALLAVSVMRPSALGTAALVLGWGVAVVLFATFLGLDHRHRALVATHFASVRRMVVGSARS